MERLAMDNIQPIFLSQPPKASESTCTVSCKVFNINGPYNHNTNFKKTYSDNM